MARLWLLASLAVLIPASAGAQAALQPLAGKMVTNPDWLEQPSAEAIARADPPSAAGLSGHATLNCAVADDGSVSQCNVASETPPDVGFGAAALQLSSLYRMRPTTRDGVPVGGAVVTIFVRFGPSR